jgi:phosphatidylserine/phosphatidylglycerophosphate/cardiolipin synthase-like enzyme
MQCLPKTFERKRKRGVQRKTNACSLRATFKRNFRKIATMCETISKNELLLGSDFSDRVIELIDSADSSIYIFMFDWKWYKNDFSCDVSRINQALVRATRRGVKVQTLLNYSEIVEILNNLNITARRANVRKLLHAKSIVIDENIIILGSHNLSKEAMTANVEMSLVISDPELAKRIINYFQTIWSS